MTNHKNAGLAGGITLASIAAAFVLVAGAWSQGGPLIRDIGAILAREQVQAVLSALAGGVLLGAWLPHVLPKHWSPARTQLVTGAACSLLTLTAAALLVSTRTGAVYAVLAAVATPTVSRSAAGLIYWLKPCVKPESLQP
jgi:hypothetical protein